MPIAEYFAASALIVLITLAVAALVKDFWPETLMRTTNKKALAQF